MNTPIGMSRLPMPSGMACAEQKFHALHVVHEQLFEIARPLLLHHAEGQFFHFALQAHAQIVQRVERRNVRKGQPAEVEHEVQYKADGNARHSAYGKLPRNALARNERRDDLIRKYVRQDLRSHCYDNHDRRYNGENLVLTRVLQDTFYHIASCTFICSHMRTYMPKELPPLRAAEFTARNRAFYTSRTVRTSSRRCALPPPL